MAHEVKTRRRKIAGRSGNAQPTADAIDAVDASRNPARLLPWVVGIIAFFIYLRTMTPGMEMGDGTELATAAYVLGVPHPTGYPLYMLLCKFWLVITMGGDVIVRATILNGLLMSAAAGITSLILADLVRSIWKTADDKTIIVWSAVGGLTAAFLRFHWANAVVTEVYALQFLLMVLFTRTAQKMDMAGYASRKYLLWSTVLLALGLAHHRLSITMILPWAGLWFWAWRSASTGDSNRRRLPWIPAVVILVAGLSLYAYLPIRASFDPPVNWGNPDSWSRFYNHVRGTEYLDRGLLKPALGQSFSAATFALFLRLQSIHLLSDLAGQFVPFHEQFTALPGTQKVFVSAGGFVIILGLLIFAAAAWGTVLIWKSGRRASAAVLAAVAVQNIVILYVYNIADIRDYFLYPFWAAWLGLFVAAAWLARNLAPQGKLATGYVMLLIPVGVLAGNWHQNDRNGDVSAEVLSRVILPENVDDMPSGSILITDDDSDTFTTWYRQNVRGERRDVLNFAGNFIYMPWYMTFFSDKERRDYQIKPAAAVARSAEEYVSQLRNGIIDANIEKHPVFASIDDVAVLSILARTYKVEPVDAAQITNRSLFDEPTTSVLYRIRVKEQAQ